LQVQINEIVLTKAKGNEEYLTGIKMKKRRMVSSKGQLRILYYGPKGGKTTKVREQLRIPIPR